METLNMRQKKKKTRRCLDELRKRTHQTNYKNTIGKAQKHKPCCLKTCNYITHNRLTLLNKTVKSETVTRLQITDLKNKKLNKSNSNNIESGFHKYLISHEPAQYDVNNILEKYSDTITEDTSGTENVSPNVQIPEEDNHESPKSIILFSPGIHDEDSLATNINPNSSNEIHISSRTSSSSPPSPNSNINWYDYYMDKLQRYMEKKFPQTTCDSIEKCRAALIESYIKNQNTEAEEYTISYDDITNNNESSEENMIQNPKDYLGYSWKYLPYTKSSGVTSPTTSNSSDSICIPFNSPISTSVYDTPEYSYYPHRLN